jgi:PAP2 superfamily
VIAVMTAAFLALRRWFPTRIALGAEYFILSLAGTAVLMVFSYLCMASAQGPLIDQMLLRGDRALGFDWLALHDRIMAHKPLAVAGRLLYQSLIIQGLYCTILLALMQQRTWMRELWRLTFIASVLCCLGGMLFPALGPYKIFHLESEGTFLPAMEHLLGHRSLVFAPSGMTGVICFPSLHTVMALAYAYGLRRTGPLFFIFAGLNTLMLFTIPFFGGHYLMDMLAGAGVMPVSVALMRLSFAAQAGMNARRVSVLVEKTA